MTVLLKTKLPLSAQLNIDRRRWLNTGLSSALILSQALNAGCSREVERTFEYLQDVKLNDGKIITLRFKDVILFSGKNTDNYKKIAKQEMWYDPLGIYYVNEPWDIDGAQRLLSFDIVNGVPMLVQYAHHKDMVRRQVPNYCRLNYLKWVGKNWVEVTESEFPLHAVGYNLGRNIYERDDSKILQKRGMLNFPKMGDTPLTMLEYAKGVGICSWERTPTQNQGGTK